MNRIMLGYASNENSDGFNFGDELSKYIVEKVFKKQVTNLICRNRIHALLYLIKITVEFKVNKEKATKLIRQIKSRNYLLAIGSVLQSFDGKGGIVWGTGIISSNEIIRANHTYYAVRGPKTRELLIKQGKEIGEIYGDPALLLPLFYKPEIKLENNKILLVPHVIHFEKIYAKNSKKFEIVNLATKNIEKVINELMGAELILSSSLHGLIVAHAYGVPALWVDFSMDYLIGKDFKFIDYFESVGIKPYEAIKIEDLISKDVGEIKNIYQEQMLPTINIKKIQNQLISQAEKISLII